MITATTDKKPVYLGKPNAKVVELCLLDSGFSKEETIVVGDRLYTDIACGVNTGIGSIFVLSGEGTLSDVKESKTKPQYIFNNINL